MEWPQGHFILVCILCCWTEPHPICEADGICLCFYSRMGCWPLCTLILSSAWWDSTLPSPLCWNFPLWWYDLWCYYGHILGRGPSDVLWISLQRSLITLLCTLHHTPTCHIYIYRWCHFLCYVFFVFGSHQ